MEIISIAAQAAQHIMQQVQAGELEVHGIMLRDSATKQFRYILKGLEDLPAESDALKNLPALEPLRVAMTAQQILGAVATAQNAALARSLARIESKLDAIDQRLTGIDRRLEEVKADISLVLAVMREAPAGRLKAAINSWRLAQQHNDTTSRIAACLTAEKAARDLLAQARHLARVEIRCVPAALLRPREMLDIASAAMDGALIAGMMHHRLGAPDQATRIVDEFNTAIREIGRSLAQGLRDPELMMRRISAGMAADSDIQALGNGLRRSCIVAETVITLADLNMLEVEADVTSDKSRQAQGIDLVLIGQEANSNLLSTAAQIEDVKTSWRG